MSSLRPKSSARGSARLPLLAKDYACSHMVDAQGRYCSCDHKEEAGHGKQNNNHICNFAESPIACLKSPASFLRFMAKVLEVLGYGTEKQT